MVLQRGNDEADRRLSSSPADGVQADAASPRLLAALLTPPGRGALAVVGVAGPSAAAAVDRLFAARGTTPVGGRPDGSITFGTWRSTGEHVVAVRHADDRFEIHCHGGVAAATAVLEGLEGGGARSVAWREWLAAEGGSETVREAREALVLTAGPKAAQLLARQAAGMLDREVARIAALAVDGDAESAAGSAARLLAASRVGLRLTAPWRIVLAGRVNAGKSSLLNAILGHGRSIVSAEAGTTRDVVAARAVLGGWEVEIVDAAGTRDDEAGMTDVERAGIARAIAAREAADLVVRVVAADDPAGPAAAASSGELVVVSKIDLAPHVMRTGAVATSAVTGAGIDALLVAIVDRLVPEERLDPILLAGPVPFTRRQVEAIERMAGSGIDQPPPLPAASSADLPRT